MKKRKKYVTISTVQEKNIDYNHLSPSREPKNEEVGKIVKIFYLDSTV
ncbi:MAG: hypothetical protein LBG52_04040 [Candidatus Peribacteria bacterium]|nr:hypothetical protein [Candidatus Peribacteria bacterium]